MKKVILAVILVFSFTTFVVPMVEAGEPMALGKTISIIIGEKLIILSIEDGEISPKLLHGFLISVKRLLKTWVFDKYRVVFLRHSESTAGNSTGTAKLGKEVYQFYGHFCDGKRDISKKLYR